MIRKNAVSRYMPAGRCIDAGPEGTLFFDIETTGLSPEHSHLYLIGCADFDGTRWNITQWFAENSSEEFAILEAFLRHAANFSHIVTFNGASFDIPYLRKKCAGYLLPDTPLDTPATDIYRVVKPFRKLLSLNGLGQTHIERWLGLYREDCYSGKELINVYRRYKKEKSETLLQTLLLHNLEDLEGMLFCVSILAYQDAFDGRFAFLNGETKNGAKEKQCVFSFLPDTPVPKPLRFQCAQGSVHMEADRLTVILPVVNDTVRCYYPDYEHYMLLPAEHVLIHKKLAKLTGASGSVPAALDTCYQTVSLSGSLLSDEKKAKKLSENFLKWILRYVSEKR